MILLIEAARKLLPGVGLAGARKWRIRHLVLSLSSYLLIIIILSSSHLLIIILISNPCILHDFIIDSSSQPCAKHKMAGYDNHSPTVQPGKVFQKKKRTPTLRHLTLTRIRKEILWWVQRVEYAVLGRFWVEAQFGLCHVPDTGEQITENKEVNVC